MLSISLSTLNHSITNRICSIHSQCNKWSKPSSACGCVMNLFWGPNLCLICLKQPCKETSDNNNKNRATASENRPTISLTHLKHFAKICYNLIIQSVKKGDLDENRYKLAMIRKRRNQKEIPTPTKSRREKTKLTIRYLY